MDVNSTVVEVIQGEQQSMVTFWSLAKSSIRENIALKILYILSCLEVVGLVLLVLAVIIAAAVGSEDDYGYSWIGNIGFITYTAIVISTTARYDHKNEKYFLKNGHSYEKLKSSFWSKVNSVVRKWLIVCLAAAILTFVVALLRFTVETFFIKQTKWSAYYVKHYLKFIGISLSVGINALPLGIPLAILVLFAYTQKKLSDRGITLRRLYLCGSFAINDSKFEESQLEDKLKESGLSIERQSGNTTIISASNIAIVEVQFLNKLPEMFTMSHKCISAVKKYFQWQFTFCLVVLIMGITGAVVTEDFELPNIMLLHLWVCPAIALALLLDKDSKTDVQTSNFMPRSMVITIVGQATYQLSVIFLLLFYGPQLLGIDSGFYGPLEAPPSDHFTIVSNTFVLMTIVNVINCRKVDGGRNVFRKASLISVIVIFLIGVLQVVIVEMGGRAFSTAPLDRTQWAACVLFALGSLFWHQVILCCHCTL